MSTKYLDYDGLLYFWQKIKANFVTGISYDSTSKKISQTKNGSSSDIVTLSTVATSGSYNDLSNKPSNASGSAAGFMSSDHYTKLEGIASGAEVNVQSDWNQTTDTADDFIKNKPTIPTLKNVFGKVKVGSSTIEADTTQDTLELYAGSNITLTPDTTNDKVTIAATDTTYSNASGSAAGLMSSDHYTKLEGIASGAEVNVQSDWNQSTNTADDYIKNKPTLGAAAAKGIVSTISSDSDDLPTATAVKAYVSGAVTGGAAFQGTAPTTFAPTNYVAGWYWVVGTAGTYVGETCEPGDMIFATSNYSSAYSASDFDVIQTNLDITSISNAEIDTIVAA